MEQNKRVCEKDEGLSCDCGPCTDRRTRRRFLDFSGRYLSNAKNAEKQMKDCGLVT